MSKTEARDIVIGETPDCSREEIMRAWQFLVDHGFVWDMGEWYSHMASELIAHGDVQRNAA